MPVISSELVSVTLIYGEIPFFVFFVFFPLFSFGYVILIFGQHAFIYINSHDCHIYNYLHNRVI